MDTKTESFPVVDGVPLRLSFDPAAIRGPFDFEDDPGRRARGRKSDPNPARSLSAASRSSSKRWCQPGFTPRAEDHSAPGLTRFG